MSPVSRQKKQKGQQYVTTLEASDSKAAQIDLLYVGVQEITPIEIKKGIAPQKPSFCSLHTSSRAFVR